MAVRPADVRAIVERVCARPEVLDACARGNLGTVIDALRTGGLTQGRISGLTGIPQGRLSEWNTGKREPRGISTFQKFADGVGMPPAARRALGLDSEAPPSAPASSPDLSMPHPGYAGRCHPERLAALASGPQRRHRIAARQSRPPHVERRLAALAGRPGTRPRGTGLGRRHRHVRRGPLPGHRRHVRPA